MSLDNIKNEISKLSLFQSNKNENELVRIYNILDEYFNEKSTIEDFFIYYEYGILENKEYLIINVLTKENIYEISFMQNQSRIDILPLSTVKRIEVIEHEAIEEEDNVIPPSFIIKIYHDIGSVVRSDGSLTGIATTVIAKGNEIANLKVFSEKIRKKVFNA